MLIAKCFASLKIGALCAVLAMQTNNNGGSKETDVNEFAVNPRGKPSVSVVVMIVTPVAKLPNASLRERILSELPYSLGFLLLPKYFSLCSPILGGVIAFGAGFKLNLIGFAATFQSLLVLS